MVAIYRPALTCYLTACDAAAPSMEAPRARVWTGADLAEHEPALRQVATHLCRRAWDTDDLVQDAFERALKFLSAGNPAPDHMRGWLISILRNAFIDRVRKKIAPHEPVGDHATPEPDPEPIWSRLSVDDVRAALGRLEPEVRRVFELHYMDGLRYREIAAKLAIPENTVASKLFRARKLLRGQLERGHDPTSR